jgi:hypothetical protein
MRYNKQYKLKICAICNKEFIPSGNNQKYCSKECHKNYIKKCHTLKASKNKICQICDKEFTPKNNRQKYCSKECYRNEHRLIDNVRLRVWHALKNNIKSAHTKELLGCTSEECWKHLEKQFKSDATRIMTRENYGEWEVDHIIPCSSFDLSDPEQQRKCFNYTNLQPLWKEENRKKYCKY